METELVLFRASPIHGLGGFAKEAIAGGRRIIEYAGEQIDKRESLRRCAANNEYIFGLNDRHDLDGNVAWNLARFLNHSCEPNCRAESDGGRIWIVAERDIAAGEEVTFNYGFDLEAYREHPCHCGARSCVGYIVAEAFFDHVRRQGEVRECGLAETAVFDSYAAVSMGNARRSARESSAPIVSKGPWEPAELSFPEDCRRDR